MPFITTNQTRIFYRLEGKDGLPVIVLSHSIGTDHEMWAPQVPDVTEYFQVLRYDTRGHGASDSPSGEYSIEQLGRDALALVDVLNIPKFAFCGLSMGGAIGQWLATRAGASHAPCPRQHISSVWDARTLEQSNSGGTPRGHGRHLGNGTRTVLFSRVSRPFQAGSFKYPFSAARNHIRRLHGLLCGPARFRFNRGSGKDQNAHSRDHGRERCLDPVDW